MQFSKYNKYKDGANVKITASSSTEAQPPSRGGGDTARTIWGQYDDGGDISESMKVEGNIYIKAAKENNENDDEDVDKDEWTDEDEGNDDDFDWDWDEDREGGNLYVEKKVKSKEIETSEDVTVGRHLYITNPHPAHSGEKKCVGDMIGELYNIVCPIGSIIAFNGNQSIPDNWAVCDGTNGTPDLSGKFIKGTSDRTEVGTTGGQTEIKITTSTLPKHSHDFRYTPADWFIMSSGYTLPTVNVGEGDGSVTALGTGNLDTIGSISGTTDTAGDDVANNDPINIEPPYYTLIYIMRVK